MISCGELRKKAYLLTFVDYHRPNHHRTTLCDSTTYSSHVSVARILRSSPIMLCCARAAIKRRISRHFGTAAPKAGDNVVVGMSGGVDSSVTAALLAQQDYNLSAVFMRNWDYRDESGTDKGCQWEKDWNDVQRVCKTLDIPCHMVDLSRQYWNQVFEPSLRVWEAGLTPNPDVSCNREIKFGALLEHLPDKNAWFATGHYARKGWSEAHGRPLLKRSADPTKDQTYYLASIPEAGLARALFPLGDYTKTKARELAKQYALPTADREESMGLCFVGERRKFHKFLESYLPPRPGPVFDEVTGRKVGTHEGLWTYTIGQRARMGGLPTKMFVSSKDEATNSLFIVRGSDHPRLFRNSYSPVDWHWIWADTPPKELLSEGRFRGTAQIRHRQMGVPCTVIANETTGGLTINMDTPQHGVAMGQVLALWDEEGVCLGCGLVAEAEML